MTPADDASNRERGHRLPRRSRHDEPTSSFDGGAREVRGDSDEATESAEARATWGGLRRDVTGDATTQVTASRDEPQHTQVAPVTPPTQPLPAEPSGATRAMPKPPSRDMVGRFEILEKIGEGGMGVVYRAVDPEDPKRREVAVKVLRPHIAYDPDARTRLAREVSTLERVHHPNVASVVDADPYGPRPYIATEYVPGIPLDRVVNSGGPLSTEQLTDLGRELAAAIDAIHAAGVVHRDLKPSNVLMVGSRPILIDFGIAHIADDARLTSTGLVMGTPGYLSPELVEGAPVSQSTDWWGWAATLAFAAQGEPPFGRGPMPIVLDRVTRGQANLTGVDGRLRPLLAAALSPVPGERPEARQVVEQMDRYSRGEPTTIVPVRRPEEPSRPAGRDPRADAPRRERRETSPSRPDSSPRFDKPAGFDTPAPSTSVMPRQDATRVEPVQPRPLDNQPAGFVGTSRGQQSRPERNDRGLAPVSGASPSGASPYAGREQRPATSAPRPQTHPGEHDPRIHLPSRTGTLQALFLLWLGITALLPVLGLILLVVWNLVARFADFTVTSTVLRRYEAGRRKSDGAVAVASSPWHALRAFISTVVALILPAVVFACIGALVGVGWAALSGGVARAWWALPMTVGAAAAQYTMWRGPASTTYRRGSRSVVRGLVPSGAALPVALALGALGVFFLIGSYLHGGDISWSPLTGGIADPLAEYLPN